jgi:hypothetical protein
MPSKAATLRAPASSRTARPRRRGAGEVCDLLHPRGRGKHRRPPHADIFKFHKLHRNDVIQSSVLGQLNHFLDNLIIFGTTQGTTCILQYLYA